MKNAKHALGSAAMLVISACIAACSADDGGSGGVTPPPGKDAAEGPDASLDAVPEAMPEAAQDTSAPETGIDASEEEAAGPTGPGNIGAACTADSECLQGLECLLPTDKWLGGGGPAGGYCTARCTVPADCTAFDPASQCLVNPAEWTDGKGYCFETCKHGPAISVGNFGKFDPAKCHGRKDVACYDLYDQNNNPMGQYCNPVCGTDADCGGGLRCEKYWNLCVSTPPQSGKIPHGTYCGDVFSDAGAQDNCEGYCIEYGDGKVCSHFCTMDCVFGRADTCGMEQNPPKGGCVISSLTLGTGDLGNCLQYCDTVADCLDQIDKPVCDLSLVQMIGRGVCNTAGVDGTCATL
jgi:hypothetical protein